MKLRLNLYDELAAELGCHRTAAKRIIFLALYGKTDCLTVATRSRLYYFLERKGLLDENGKFIL